MTTHRVTLGRGAGGALPHRHHGSTELFFVVGGALEVLVGDEVVTGRAGDVLVVPPGLVHAFAAPADGTSDVLVVITPGIARFDYFRHVVRRRAGLEAPDVLLGLQDRFDTHAADSPAWEAHRA